VGWFMSTGMLTDRDSSRTTMLADGDAMHRDLARGEAIYSDLGLLRLLQIVSAVFPVGAFAYSSGLEAAVTFGLVGDESSLERWIEGVGGQTLVALDVPVLIAARAAWADGDQVRALWLADYIVAFRESSELGVQEQRVGRSFARALVNLGVSQAECLAAASASYVVAFALASARFEIAARGAAFGYCFAWIEQQVSAAARLLPLGQSTLQRVLSRLMQRIPAWVDAALSSSECSLELPEVGASAPGLAMVSAWHETQHTRLFLS
jgi:urease accessory protein